MSNSASAKTSRARAAPLVPHSWELDSWETIAPDVWPHTIARAKWISRAYRKELIEANALTRVGKTLIFMGAAYTRWLERRSKHVTEFASNNPGLKRAAIAAEVARQQTP
jgi:hypothetical protein